VFGAHEPGGTIHHLAEAAGHALPAAGGAASWFVTALCSGIVGLIVGGAIVPLVHLAGKLRG